MASDSPRPPPASLRRRAILFLFFPLPRDVVVLSPLLLVPIQLAPGLVDPGSSRVHVSAVCEPYLTEKDVHPFLLPEGLGPDPLDPRPPGEDHQSVRNEFDDLDVVVDDHRRPSSRLHESPQCLRYHESVFPIEAC